MQSGKGSLGGLCPGKTVYRKLKEQKKAEREKKKKEQLEKQAAKKKEREEKKKREADERKKRKRPAAGRRPRARRRLRLESDSDQSEPDTEPEHSESPEPEQSPERESNTGNPSSQPGPSTNHPRRRGVLPAHFRDDVSSNDGVFCELCKLNEPLGLAASTVFWVDCDSCGTWVHNYCAFKKNAVSRRYKCKKCS